jgi:spermidine synthase
VVLGGGIGVYASSIAHYFAAARITSVEVDSNVVEVARRCFSFPPPSSSGIGSGSSSSSSSSVDGRKANTAGQTTTAGSPGTAGGSTHTHTGRRIEVVTADGRSYLDNSVRAGSADIIFVDAFDGHGERTRDVYYVKYFVP